MIRFLLFIFGVFVALLSSEFGLRLYYYNSIFAPHYSNEKSLRKPHLTRGWMLEPSKSAWQQTLSYKVLVSTNSKSQRDVEHSITKLPDKYRIGIFGDSYMEAYQVDLERSFPRLLEKALNSHSAETINFGVGGYGTAQEYLYLEEEGLQSNLDLVIVALYLGNDIRNNSKILERQLWRKDAVKVYARPFASVDLDGNLIISSPDYDRYVETLENVNSRINSESWYSQTLIFKTASSAYRTFSFKNSNKIKYDPNVYFGPFLENFDSGSYKFSLSNYEYKQAWDEAWDITRRVLVQMKQKSENAGAKFVLVLIPAEFQYDFELFKQLKTQFPNLQFDLDSATDKLIQGELKNVNIVDLTPGFRQIYSEENGPLNYQLDDRHWNPEGHKVAADMVARYLEEQGFFTLKDS